MYKEYLLILQLEVICFELAGGPCPAGWAIEEERYQELMHEHHYLGRLPKISETLWYIALGMTNG